jgi:hypothetical protein
MLFVEKMVHRLIKMSGDRVNRPEMCHENLCGVILGIWKTCQIKGAKRGHSSYHIILRNSFNAYVMPLGQCIVVEPLV